LIVLFLFSYKGYQQKHRQLFICIFKNNKGTTQFI